MPKNSKKTQCSVAFGREHLSGEVCDMLLRDRTTRRNVYWATDFNESLGEGYGFFDEIAPGLVGCVGMANLISVAERSEEEKRRRIRDMGEVCTPAWMCNKMLNDVDEMWFGRRWPFNTECESSDGQPCWEPTKRVKFPRDRRWLDYVGEPRLELACGEAPFLVSRKDVATGKYIAVPNRIGILDRKMRVVGENASSYDQWLASAQLAYKSVYGCEWQGEKVFLAREALLLSFFDYHAMQFGTTPDESIVQRIADILSWNIWQMDALTGELPQLHENKEPDYQRARHPLIMDWPKGKKVRFKSIMGSCIQNVGKGESL